MKKYWGLWNSRYDIADCFGKSANSPMFPTEDEMIFAAYDSNGLNGLAFVLYKRNDKLYEVNGSHCSCFDLKRQWDPEKTTLQALMQRRFSGLNGDARRALHEALKELAT